MWTLPEAHRLDERLGRFARIIRYGPARHRHLRSDQGRSDAARRTPPTRSPSWTPRGPSRRWARRLGRRALAPRRSPPCIPSASRDSSRWRRPWAAAPRPRRKSRRRPQKPRGPRLAPRDDAHVDTDWLDDPVRLDRAERYIRTSTTPRQARRLVGTGADVAVLEAGLRSLGRSGCAWPAAVRTSTGSNPRDATPSKILSPDPSRTGAMSSVSSSTTPATEIRRCTARNGVRTADREAVGLMSTGRDQRSCAARLRARGARDRADGVRLGHRRRRTRGNVAEPMQPAHVSLWLGSTWKHA